MNFKTLTIAAAIVFMTGLGVAAPASAQNNAAPAAPAADAAAPAAQRFDLATARAGAVAQALAGYGIPTPRIAVGVACTDASVAGASAQLYTES